MINFVIQEVHRLKSCLMKDDRWRCIDALQSICCAHASMKQMEAIQL